MNKQSDNVLISIIMPAYNSEKYIADAIVSVINQTYTYWELIVIDDGSNDNTLSIAKNYAINDDRIVVYKNDVNKGVSATRNHGIAIAKGEWIAFLDSDDKWISNKLEKQLSYARQTGAEFIFTGASFINEESEPFNGVFSVPNKVDYKRLRCHNVISCSSVLIKKDLFKSFKMERDDIHEDYAVWLKILRTGICAYGIDEPLLIYRLTAKSKSGNKLKSIVMTYKVFRHIGLNSFASVYFTIRHLLGAIRKYSKIKR